MPDYKKLQSFVEAALNNPKHPVYQLGMQHSPILRHYALNVSVLESVKPEDWFKQYPDYTAKLEEVMKLCEEQEETPTPQGDGVVFTPEEIAFLKANFAEWKSKAATPPPAETGEETPAGE